MDAFWREHKRFVGIAAVFLLVAGMGSCVLIAPAFRGAARIAAERRQAAEILEKRLKEEGSPSAGDIEDLLALYEKEKARIAREGAAAKVIEGFARAPSSDAERNELAAWTLVANVLLNLDETQTKE